MSSARPIRIAIVDDDASLCQAMERLMRAAGFQSNTCCSAEAFLGDSNRNRADCILLDIQFGSGWSSVIGDEYSVNRDR